MIVLDMLTSIHKEMEKELDINGHVAPAWLNYG